MMAQSNASDRQEMAHISRSDNSLLANEKKYTTVEVASSVFIPALFADYLFRTPSLSGQAFVSDDCLPVSLRGLVQHRLADSRDVFDSELHRQGPSGQLCAQATRPIDGGARCEQYTFGLRCLYARGLLPAAIRWANRHCTGPVQGLSGRLFYREASLAAQLSAPLAMSFTASISRAPVARYTHVRSDRNVRTQHQPVTTDSTAPRPRTQRGTRSVAPCEASSALHKPRKYDKPRKYGGGIRSLSGHQTPDQTRLLQESPQQFAGCAGYKPAKSTQPKDSPCSTRS